MRKGIFVSILVILFLGVFCTVVYSAEGEEGDYLITESGGVLSLYEYEGGTPKHILDGSAYTVFSRLSECGNSIRIIADGVTITEDFELPTGNYLINGRITLSEGVRMTISEGCNLEFSDSELELMENSLLRVKGGGLVLKNTDVVCRENTVIKLDYSVSSNFTVQGGGIRSYSALSAIENSSGSVTIIDGKIENNSTAAISNSSSLYICGSSEIVGVGEDIKTTKGITLSKNGYGYSSDKPMTVRYLAEFENGRMTEVFYRAEKSSADNITLLSKSGKEYALTYFESSEHTDEKKFYAVYLPFSVKLFDGGELIGEEKKLYGELLGEIGADTKIGYNFGGWYKDEDMRLPFSFDEGIFEDMKLYAKYSLEPPCFSVSSLNFIYDGNERNLAFSNIHHPLYESGGFYSYTWYKDGVLISEAASPKVKSVLDSGSYSCILTFHYLSDSISVPIEGISVVIEKAELKPPTPDPKEYNGEPLYADIPLSSLYTYEKQSFTERGTYKITLKLTDTDNYCWEGSESDEIRVDFEIKPANNRFITEPSVNDVYFGNEPKVISTPLFGKAVYLYSAEKDGEYKPIPPSAVGKYYVKCVVYGTENYLELVSEPISFRILEERVVSLGVLTDAQKLQYKTFDTFNPTGLSIKAGYNSGREESIGLDKISFSYQRGECFLYKDSGVILSFGGVNLVYPIEVIKSEYDLSGFNTSGIVIEYDGAFHAYEHSYEPIIGKDGLPLTYKVYGGGTDAGKYELELRFSTDSKEYSVPEPIILSLEIKKKEVVLIWENTEFVYDGKSKLPKAYYKDVFGAVRYPEPYGAKITAGEGYIAKIKSEDKNYLFKNPETEFGILKADYDFSKVKWSAESFVYDGEEKTVTATGLPEGVFIIGYTDNKYTESGTYKLTATLSYDMTNYNPPPALTFTWSILPREYDMSGIEFLDVLAVYDGNIHYPEFKGELPVGIDGSTPTFSYSAGVTHVHEGRVAVKVMFESGSKNYEAPPSRTVYVEILSKGIEVEWICSEYVYSGAIQHPTAYSGLSEILISGSGSDAGNYTAVATAQNTDYHVLNNTKDYVILKAENSFVKPLGVSDIYEGNNAAPSAEAVYGEITYVYYKDAGCTIPATEPMQPGFYYCVAIVGESKNYKALTSDAVGFAVIEVIPQKINASLAPKTYKAFETLCGDDLVITVVYNDGSEKPADNEKVVIQYQNGSSLRKKDTIVYILYENFETEVEITVDFADYDLGRVVWKNTEQFYDGDEKKPSVTELPEGVFVKEYIGGGINAGEYNVKAVLSYDSENYNEPKMPECLLIVKKTPINIPTFKEASYCGEDLKPKADSSLYTVYYDGEIINAGSYKLVVELTDDQNYEFSGIEGASVTVDYTVSPIVLTLMVSDYDLYLFSEVAELPYTVVNGTLIGKDVLKTAQRVEGDTVLIYSLDPNYTLNGNIAKINRIDRLNPKTLENILVFLLLSVLLILLGIVLLLNRDKIRAKIIYLKDRRRKKQNVRGYYLMPGGAVAAIAGPAECEQIATESSNTSSEEDNKTEIDEKLSSQSNIIDDDIILSGDAMSVDASKADELITDSLAKNLLKRSREAVYTDGYKKEIVNVDVLSKCFEAGDRVDVNTLKKRGILEPDVAYIKILARGEINKPLSVYANDFSLSAIKMIALTGGEAVKVITVKIDGGRSDDR